MNNFEDKDLDTIHWKKSTAIRKFGPLDIFSDIDYLLSEVSRYRQKEREYGWLDSDQKTIIEAMRHLSLRTHAFDPKTCSQCDGARKAMLAIKEGDL